MSIHSSKWLLFVHQLPTKPTNLRVRVWRKLQSLGALAIKNSVYVLPFEEKTEEDFQWLRQEIESAGGEASVFRADSIEGADDEEIISAFRRQSDEEFTRLITEFERIRGELKGQKRSAALPAGKLGQYESELRSLNQELDRALATDFFSALKAPKVQESFEKCRIELHRAKGADEGKVRSQNESVEASRSKYQNRRWVTRKNPHIDRLACGWLIKRFIDRRPRFGFVDEGTPTEGSVSFDMVGADFTHRGEDCSFETIIKSFALDGDAALRQIAEIVHDVDVKDGKFNRLEANGVNTVIRGLSEIYDDDNERLKGSFSVFDGLYELFRNVELSKDETGSRTVRPKSKREK